MPASTNHHERETKCLMRLKPHARHAANVSSPGHTLRVLVSISRDGRDLSSVYRKHPWMDRISIAYRQSCIAASTTTRATSLFGLATIQWKVSVSRSQTLIHQGEWHPGASMPPCRRMQRFQRQVIT